MDINNLFSYITSSELQETILPLKLGFLAISLFFLAMIIFVLGKTEWLRHAFLEKTIEFLSYHPYKMKKVTKDWAKILKRLEKGAEAEYKLAIIEADEVFDNTLKKMEYGGKTMEEKMEQVSVILPNIDEIREAHKIRDNVVHNPNYKLGLDEAKRILETYEKALRELEVF